MKPVHPFLVALALSCAASVANASTDAAWQVHDQQVKSACLAASELQKPKVSGRAVVFDDAVGYSALLLSGRYPKPRAKHLSGSELCLFDRKTGIAHIADADNFGLVRQ